jgi:hypothetical protein
VENEGDLVLYNNKNAKPHARMQNLPVGRQGFAKAQRMFGYLCISFLCLWVKSNSRQDHHMGLGETSSPLWAKLYL